MIHLDLVTPDLWLDVVFSVPGDELDDRNESMTVPLLGIGRGVADEELDELIHAEGPNSAVRGTMMDGIANVSLSLGVLS